MTLGPIKNAIPWRKIADIGNVLRHAYDQIADVLWNVVRTHFPPLEAACQAELGRVRALEADGEDGHCSL
jgi:uncharacterized protein with HEPN domain